MTATTTVYLQRATLEQSDYRMVATAVDSRDRMTSESITLDYTQAEEFVCDCIPEPEAWGQDTFSQLTQQYYWAGHRVVAETPTADWDLWVGAAQSQH